MTPVRATRLYLAAAEYDRKCAALARLLRRERGAKTKSKEIALLNYLVERLAAEIHRLDPSSTARDGFPPHI
jgi:hypothetical protein